MNFLKKIKKIILNPSKILFLLDYKNIIRIPDKLYLKIFFKETMGYKLDLDNPKTFNEKLQWLKLHNKNPKYTEMADKYEVKKYVSNLIGEEYIIPTCGIWNKFEDIDFEKLPNKFVLKCTHDSGGVIICKDKKKLNLIETKQKINKLLKRKFYYSGREYPYKDITPRIIAEKYMGSELMDYKFFCFNGRVETILVCSNRKGDFKNTDFFDENWNKMPFTRANHENNPNKIDKPQNLEKMVEIAKKLSENIPFVRIDLYEIEGKVYFGEFTFFPSAGFEGFKPTEYDKILGDMLELPMNREEG